jgi:hypothetical protein
MTIKFNHNEEDNQMTYQEFIIHIVTAEYFDVRSLIMRAFKSRASAEREFIAIVKIIARDTIFHAKMNLSPIVDFPSAENALGRLQDYHDAAECYVKITSVELRE